MTITQTAKAVTHGSNYVGKVQDNIPDLASAEYEIGIDALSFTIGSNQFKEKYGFSGFHEVDPQNLVLYFQDFMSQVLKINFPLLELRGGRNFFQYSIPLDNDLGFIAFGGNNTCKKLNPDTGIMEQSQNEEKIQFYFTGSACSIISKQQYQKLYDALSSLQSVAIKRVDIALDCFDGTLSLDLAEYFYDEQQFKTGGKPPKFQRIKKKNDDSGETVYVGSRQSGKLFRAYEKGKQLGHTCNKWVRFEVELIANQRDIPLEVLINPRTYFAGMYPCLSFVDSIQTVIKAVKSKVKLQSEQLIIYARQGYGRLINFLVKELEYTPEQVVHNLMQSEGYPSRLRWVAHV